MVQRDLQTPHGTLVEAWLPLQSAGEPMTAHWVSLSDGREALIHKPVDRWGLFPIRTNSVQHRQGIGQPIMPEQNHRIEPAWTAIEMQREQARLPLHEASQIAQQIRQTVQRMQEKSQTAGLPRIDPLAISAAPNIPRLPSSNLGMRLIN